MKTLLTLFVLLFSFPLYAEIYYCTEDDRVGFKKNNNNPVIKIIELNSNVCGMNWVVVYEIINKHKIPDNPWYPKLLLFNLSKFELIKKP